MTKPIIKKADGKTAEPITYSIGDCFLRGEDIFQLHYVNDNVVQLSDLGDGDTWISGSLVQDAHAITQGEFEQICGGLGNAKSFTPVQITITY